ncbi:MAG TPA: glycosyltransferase [Lacunisphaera sp.]|nr:glycosyltransferase [Lacunisphaera sp.]
MEGPEGLAKSRKLAELEMQLGFRSSFNFVPEGTYAVTPELRGWLKEQGFEVGIHDLNHDGKLFSSAEGFARKAERINHYVEEWGATGFRAGFMLRNLDWYHQLNIRYDASTFDTDPFEPQPDGAGTIFPFWVDSAGAEPAKNSGGSRNGYVELPYTLPQDSTLFLLFKEKTPAIWLQKLDWVASKGGMALVNVHPDYLQFPGEAPKPWTFPVEHYVALLQHVRDHYAGGYWHVLPRDMAAFVAGLKPAHPPQKKRICLITYSFYEYDTRVFRYGQALAARGDEVDVLSLRTGPDQSAEATHDGCRVHRLQQRVINEKSKESFLKPLLLFLWRCSSWLAREQRRRPYDIVHVHNVPDFLIFAAWRPKLSGARLILDIHDLVPELFVSKFGAKAESLTVRMLKLMERASASFAHHVILANHLWLDVYTGRAAKPAKCSVIINYVESRIFHPRPRRRDPQDQRLIIIFPGSLQFHQGLDIALRAFKEVAPVLPTAEFHIYGEGQAKTDLIKLAAETGCGDRIHFHPLIPTKEIAGIMADADLGVVPKRADSFGNEAYSTKILEFMSLGVPVIASSTKIDRYYFNDSVLRFFPSGDVQALASAMIELLRDAAARRELAQRASAHARLNSWEERKSDYLQLVDGLCQKN